MRPQHTIAKQASVTGFGFWSGRDVRVEFRPAPAGSGLVFVRGDLAPSVRISAHVENRVETPRRTTLVAGGARVEMVEHVLAACAGLQIDNCEIRIDACEMPGCDGSSQPFLAALTNAGRVEQPAPRTQLVVTGVTRVGGGQSWLEARPAESDTLSLTYHLDYGSQSAIGRQSLRLDVTPSVFTEQLASARTFLLEQEARWLRQQGLGLRVSRSDLLVFGQSGPLENTLRFPDECVRHKTLDLVGDLALAGCDIVGRIEACRSGHSLNAELVRALLRQGRLAAEQRRSA